MNEVQKYEGGYAVADIRKQIDLLKKFHLPESAIDNHYVRIDIENGREFFTLCKRDKPIKVSDPYDDNCVVACQMKSYGERMGFDQPLKRGKYNDEDRIVNNQCLSVEVGEVEPFGSAT
jgi:hypothetical protein